MMYSPGKILKTPSDYEFPFTPYTIQQQLMEALYTVLEQKGIGIFESPTGTGKTLTLTCAALRWLEDHEKLVREDLQQRITAMDAEIKALEAEGAQADDWITAQFATRQQREKLQDLRTLNALLQQHEERLRGLRERQAKERRAQRISELRKQSAPIESGECESVDGDEELQLENADNNDYDQEKLEETDKQAEESYREVQIFFCSRTHSQLAQVVRELKRTPYGRRIRCVSLASRQQLCIHPQVRRLPNSVLINERCLDMARNSGTRLTAKPTACDANACVQKKARVQHTNSLSKCSFKSAAAVQQLSESALVDVLDIEELVKEGEFVKACPYYAARAATQQAQLVMLPYQMLLHRRTRLQSGIDLRGSVIIIDEAHNLLDTVASLHSCELTLQQLLLAQQQLLAYKMRYSKRFSTANLLRINQLLYVVKRLVKMLQPLAQTTATSSSRVLRTYELTAEGDFFNIDLFQLLQFCEQARLAQKLQGFAQRQSNEPEPTENQVPNTTATIGLLQRLQEQHQHGQRKRVDKSAEAGKEHKAEQQKVNEETKLSTVSPIRPLLAFLESLTESSEDGRVLINLDAASEATRCSFKYMLLNPGAHFEDIVREARAIIIAGGTMQPTAELTEQLFRSCAGRVQLRFYDHVVPSDAVLPFVVIKGPTGRSLCFNYVQRSSDQMLSELGMILQNVCNVVPSGVVCFVPSYDYLDAVYAHLQKSGVLARISAKKCVFREPRSANVGHSVEQLLAEYASAIGTEQGGALLLSVVGGKLSEGLNFADDLGRGVIVVGLPYPSRHSPELQERMKYLEATLGAGAGNEYYENLCMKAVNQCIGRSVRHIRDYACVFLLDERYSSERIQKKLPQWIARSLQTPATFGQVQAATAKFFKLKRLS